jgi:hypothetical protein
MGRGGIIMPKLRLMSLEWRPWFWVLRLHEGRFSGGNAASIIK